MNACRFLALAVFLVQQDQISGALEPTKLIHNSVYRLISQHDGRYLSLDTNSGIPTKSEGNKENLNQKFTFQNSNANNIWILVSLANETPLSNTSWQVSYVGHGKYQFKNVKTGMCLTGSATEGTCGKDNPLQRWFVEQSHA